MKKKSSKQKRKCPPFYLPMYGINNWCSIRAAALEELEGQEASLKNKARPKYVSLENAVMSRIIDNRKTKRQQKNNLSLLILNRLCLLSKQRRRQKKISL